MGQYMNRTVRHPLAGMWGRSLAKWHVVEWSESGDGSMTDGGSACGVYVGPMYLSGFQLGKLVPASAVCAKCERLALAVAATGADQ